MKPKVHALSGADVAFGVDVAALGINSSDDASHVAEFGDSRGRTALELALSAQAPGYNAFVAGVEGPRRLERIADICRNLASPGEPPKDWIYVYNFQSPERPRAIQLSAGDGRRLKTALEGLIGGLGDDLRVAFEEEAFETEKSALVEAFEAEQLEHQAEVEALARDSGVRIASQRGSVAIIPVIDGEPAQSEEQVEALGADRLQELHEIRLMIEKRLREVAERQQRNRQRLDDQIRQIERAFASKVIRPRIESLREKFDSEDLDDYLSSIVEHILDHLDPFREAPVQSRMFPFMPPLQQTEPLSIYEVNVVVDNSEFATAPVVVVDSPTYKNLFGSIERSIDRFGQVTTDFRRIHAGAFLEADGGVLVISAEDALIEPFVWRILRRALRSGRVEIEAYDPFVGFTPAGIRPLPISVDTKVLLVGPRWLFERLLAFDDEFPDLFKVLADFSPIVDRTDSTMRALCARVAEIGNAERLLPFDAGALNALVEEAVREAGDRRKLNLGSERVLDVAREAAQQATAEQKPVVERADVLAAIRDRVHRRDRIERSIREQVARDILLVTLEGSQVGQINALTVTGFGQHQFGRPARVTASVGPGRAGIVSIDRETELSGSVHNKGVLILQGFLRRRFARKRPLSLAASVVFEQSYGHVEGDSASLAELLAILSDVGQFPLRQDRGVTGSVNQAGEVQAIGGINEKVEGFFDYCEASGLTGGHGVVFPAANIEHLVLRPDVIEAIEKQSFQLFPVRNVEEALWVMTGRAAGSCETPNTVYHQVDQALEAFAVVTRETGPE